MEPLTAISRAEQNRKSAETSRATKRALGEKEYLRQKAEAGVEYRKRKKQEKEAAAAAASTEAADAQLGPPQEAAAAALATPAASAQPAPPQAAADVQLAKLAELKAANILDDGMYEAAVLRVTAAAPPPAMASSPPPAPASPAADADAGLPDHASTPEDDAYSREASWAELASTLDADADAPDDDEPPHPASAPPPAAAPQPPAAPPAAAPPPPTAPPAATPPPAAAPSPPLPTEIVALSDALGVTSALKLGAGDMLKLLKFIDEPRDSAQLVGVLRRLSMSPLTPELSRSTRIDDAVLRLATHAEPEVRELSAQITRAWSTQVAAELQRQAAELQRRRQASRPGPKPHGTGAAGCRACQGAHRAHTCGPCM